MAEDYRDPKVTTTESGSSTGTYVMYAVIGLVALLLLAWLLGLFGGDVETVATPVEGEVEAVVVPEDAADPEVTVTTEGGGDPVVLDTETTVVGD